MAIQPPTYGASYDQTEQNDNAAAIVAFLDAFQAWVDAVEHALEIAVSDHGDNERPVAAQNGLVASLQNAYDALTAALPQIPPP